MKIEIGQKVCIITKSDDSIINAKNEGFVIEAPNEATYPFSLQLKQGICPIYSTELDTWTYIVNSDIKEKVFLDK